MCLNVRSQEKSMYVYSILLGYWEPSNFFKIILNFDDMVLGYFLI